MHNEQQNKHMTLEDRIEIQECLSKGMTFKSIANRIGKSPTTNSREVKSHIQFHTNSLTIYCTSLSFPDCMPSGRFLLLFFCETKKEDILSKYIPW